MNCRIVSLYIHRYVLPHRIKIQHTNDKLYFLETLCKPFFSVGQRNVDERKTSCVFK